MIVVSDKAKEKFMEYLSSEEKEGAYVRIYVSGVGWGGPRYGLTLDESIQEDKDVVEELEGLKIVFDKGISHFMEGKSIDFQDGPQGGFAINDGSPGRSCGDCSC